MKRGSVTIQNKMDSFCKSLGATVMTNTTESRREKFGYITKYKNVGITISEVDGGYLILIAPASASIIGEKQRVFTDAERAANWIATVVDIMTESIENTHKLLRVEAEKLRPLELVALRTDLEEYGFGPKDDDISLDVVMTKRDLEVRVIYDALSGTYTIRTLLNGAERSVETPAENLGDMIEYLKDTYPLEFPVAASEDNAVGSWMGVSANERQ